MPHIRSYATILTRKINPNLTANQRMPTTESNNQTNFGLKQMASNHTKKAQVNVTANKMTNLPKRKNKQVKKQTNTRTNERMKQKCRQVLIVISVLLLGAEATCSQNRGIKKPFNEYSFDLSRNNGGKMPSSIMRSGLGRSKRCHSWDFFLIS